MKKVLFVFLLLLLALNAFADIELVQPFYSKIGNNQSLEIGAMQAGETLELSFYRKSVNLVFDSITLDESLLPSNWNYVVEKTDQSLIVKVSVPKDEIERVQKLNFSVSSKGIQERFSLIVKVQKKLLETIINKTSDEIMLGTSSSYSINLLNNSIASHTVSISSNLPWQWVQNKVITLKPKERKKIEMIVFPLVYGNKTFYFKIQSMQNDSIIDVFNINLNVKPTLRGKYFAVFSGLPFFTFNLMPFMLFDGFLALLG